MTNIVQRGWFNHQLVKHFVCKALIQCVFFPTGNAFPFCNPRIAPLVVAYETGCFDLVEKLLDERADANVRDEHLEIAVWIWFHRLWSFFREFSCVFHSLPFDLFKEDIHLVFPPGVPPSRSTVLYRLYDSLGPWLPATSRWFFQGAKNGAAGCPSHTEVQTSFQVLCGIVILHGKYYC